MFKKLLTFFSAIFCLVNFSWAQIQANSNEKNDSTGFWRQHFEQRIYMGYYKSYFDDNIGIMQFGYDGVIKLFKLAPDFNLIDISIGADVLIGYDEKTDTTLPRPKFRGIVPGIELNYNGRLYILPIRRIHTKIFVEGDWLTLVYYSVPYPAGGTNFNYGTHIGLGMEYRINPELKGYTTLRVFHTSNGKSYNENPSLNAIGIIMGLQF